MPGMQPITRTAQSRDPPDQEHNARRTAGICLSPALLVAGLAHRGKNMATASPRLKPRRQDETGRRDGKTRRQDKTGRRAGKARREEETRRQDPGENGTGQHDHPPARHKAGKTKDKMKKRRGCRPETAIRAHYAPLPPIFSDGAHREGREKNGRGLSRPPITRAK